jgi:hypothetical protein
VAGARREAETGPLASVPEPGGRRAQVERPPTVLSAAAKAEATSGRGRQESSVGVRTEVSPVGVKARAVRATGVPERVAPAVGVLMVGAPVAVIGVAAPAGMIGVKEGRRRRPGAGNRTVSTAVDAVPDQGDLRLPNAGARQTARRWSNVGLPTAYR